MDGAVNAALIQLFAIAVSVSRSKVSQGSDATDRNMIIEVEGVSIDELRNRLLHP
ncbi:MAG: hypothetical protein QF590_02635 [Dehalococcoidia bacterium]|nr:hypothetical protein [Dehalococcoidia bacterium]MDP7090173.1 hypothetical protein [Dehalococcoidia bacterium]MDP7261251.1 hypothetical protein [Dehalococcoidia bacterium]MDP7485377.1 hypothetical protein [Dehalococcoidia bacterium]